MFYQREDLELMDLCPVNNKIISSTGAADQIRLMWFDKEQFGNVSPRKYDLQRSERQTKACCELNSHNYFSAIKDTIIHENNTRKF